MANPVLSINGMTVLSAAAQKSTDFETMKKYKDGKRTDEDVLVDGVPVYKLPSNSFPILQNGVTLDNVTIRLKHVTDYSPATYYKLTGSVSVTAWSRPNTTYVSYTVTADGMEPVKA